MSYPTYNYDHRNEHLHILPFILIIIMKFCYYLVWIIKRWCWYNRSSDGNHNWSNHNKSGSNLSHSYETLETLPSNSASSAIIKTARAWSGVVCCLRGGSVQRDLVQVASFIDCVEFLVHKRMFKGSSSWVCNAFKSGEWGDDHLLFVIVTPCYRLPLLPLLRGKTIISCRGFNFDIALSTASWELKWALVYKFG